MTQNASLDFGVGVGVGVEVFRSSEYLKLHLDLIHLQ